MIGWKEMIREDEEAILHRDPAAKSLLEVRLCYPCLLYTSDAADEL